MKKRSFKKRQLIIPGLILLVAAVLFAVPRFAKYYIIKHSREIIGREISIGKIRIGYLTGTLTVRNLKLFEEKDSSAFLSFSRFRINIDYLPLFRREIVVKYVSLDDPYIQVLQNGTTFNFTDLIDNDTTVSVKDSIPGEPARYIINNISINGGYVKYTDIALNHTISLDSLDLQIPGFTWNSDTANLDVGFRFVEGGGISSGFSVNQADSTYSVNLKIDSLNLKIIEPYAASNLNISDISGYYSGELLIKGSISSVLKLFVRGENHISGFRLNDNIKRTILSFDDLSVGLDTFDLEQSKIRINNVSLSGPMILFELNDTVNNWITLLKSEDQGQEEQIVGTEKDSTDSSVDFSYNIPPVEITGGKILFNDINLKYPFGYTIEDLNLKLSEKPGTKERISFSISASLNGTGTLNTRGEIDLADPTNDMDMSLDIKQFRMADMDAYFKHYFGFPVTGGIMNFSTANTLRPGSLQSDNNIHFRRFTLAKKLPDETEYKVPLRLAIGVLTDKDGIIDLKAPVRMKGEEVKIINLGRIIFRVIGNLFVKAALSPFNLLSGLQGVSEDSLSEIKLNLTDESPDEKGINSLDVLSDIINKKPLLGMNLIYCINRERAIDSLAYIMCVADYQSSDAAGQGDPVEINDSLLTRFILSKNPADSSLAVSALNALYTKYIGPDRINVRLDSLRTRQTGFIRDYLGIERALPQNRFRIIETTPDSLKSTSANPSLRIYLTDSM